MLLFEQLRLDSFRDPGQHILSRSPTAKTMATGYPLFERRANNRTKSRGRGCRGRGSARAVKSFEIPAGASGH